MSAQTDLQNSQDASFWISLLETMNVQEACVTAACDMAMMLAIAVVCFS